VPPLLSPTPARCSPVYFKFLRFLRKLSAFPSRDQYLLYNWLNRDDFIPKQYHIYLSQYYTSINFIFSTSTKLHEMPPWIAQLCQNATKITPLTAMSWRKRKRKKKCK
jgi:hypothetical protein